MLIGLLFLLAVARADEPPPEEDPESAQSPDDDWLILAVEPDFGSAMPAGPDTPAPQPSSAETAPPGVALPTPQAHLAGRWFVRPWLGVEWAPGAAGSWGMAAGALGGHQWWSLASGPVRPAGETRMRAALPFAGAGGWLASLDATAGAWMGPVGLLGGASVRAERLVFDGQEVLAPALAAGPRAHLAVQVGPLTPWLAASPTWLVAGARPARAGPWDQLELAGGLEWSRRPVGLRASGTRRDTGQGVTFEASLGLVFRLL